MKRFQTLSRTTLIWLLLVVVSACSQADTAPRTLLILYTNDIHDHVRPRADGRGGLPWIAGHVAAVRASRNDVILLDAGDATEKGDLVAFLTGSRITLEGMGRIGYDAIAVGNHEHNFGLDAVKDFHTAAGARMLALNLVDEDGSPLLPVSRMIDRNGVRVGVIGMALPRPRDTLDFEASGLALADEAQRLREVEGAEVVIVVCHVGVADAERWSAMAPAVDVFVTGHTHKTLHSAKVFESTGALAVQAGSNARWVGHLELTIDDGGTIVSHRSHLVEMKHDRVEPDETLLAWIIEHESQLAPDADEVITVLDAPLEWFAIARLKAEALRVYGDADIGLYHPTHVVRNLLLPGPVTVNALFRTAADRGHPLIDTSLTGAEITAYLNGLAVRDYARWGLTQWAGFEVEIDGAAGVHVIETSLDPDQSYRVVMPEREWEKRFLRLTEQLDADEREGVLAERDFSAHPAGFSSVDALAAYLRDLEEPVASNLATLRQRQGDADAWEAPLAQRILARQLADAARD